MFDTPKQYTEEITVLGEKINLSTSPKKTRKPRNVKKI